MKRLFNKNRNARRGVRHARLRARLGGTAEKPRLSVFRSLRGVSLQLIDDEAKKTICQANSREVKAPKVEGKKAKTAAAYATGELLAERAKAKGIVAAVFDRGGYRYHGRVAAAAEGARAGGIKC
ncbi:MAG: 50S ribosomal protein L18 [Patescibacteria group bacterium]|nr:50S ribosomal protein L18 [Patescibacteria group bacterium]